VKARLKDVDTHFAFGENWAEYANSITDRHLQQASAGLERLLGGQLEGKRFLDIGCGSGVHSLAALKAGVREILAVDIDPNSVATTQKTLSTFAPNGPFQTRVVSVFELDPARIGERFDVVYSWGVLHHTGDMNLALSRAASMVAPDGLFAFALYRKTWSCPFWKVEKRWYSRTTKERQQMARRLYERWFRFIGRRYYDVDEYINNYSAMRGMDFQIDIHDWLGGYPYESALPAEVDALLTRLGFRLEKKLLCHSSEARVHGLLGSGCDEYVYRRVAEHS
jgi:2-polyprenyl-6-hydroxyphenyl methylase/3-demethylubiquinone-9 3-methyltransferase